ncbi:MAG: ectoine synthase [Pseudomonadota bacterium]
MIVRKLDEILGGERDVAGPGWQSRRLILATDCMGFTLNDTVIAAGAELTLEYKHHLEACYCISGRGELTDLATGETHSLSPGTLYALDKNDRHCVRAIDGDMRLVSVFNPPLTGAEVHREDGSYAPAD